MDDYTRDLPSKLSIPYTGLNGVPPIDNRGAFKYLTVFIPEKEVWSEGASYESGWLAPGQESSQREG